MMRKTVYCSFTDNPGHLKKVKYTKTDDVSDRKAIVNGLRMAASKDQLLGLMLKGKQITVQILHAKKNRMYDVDSEEEIEDEADVNILLDALNTVPDISTKQKLSELVAELNVPVLVANEQIEVKDGNEHKDTTNEENDKENNSTLSNRSEDGKKQKPTKKIVAKPLVRRLTNPVRLPKLTPELQKFVDEGRVLQRGKDFIQHWALYIESLTEGYPTRQEYVEFSQTIVSTFPELKGGTGGYGIVKSQIQRNITNRRLYNRKEAKAGPSGCKQFTIQTEEPSKKKSKLTPLIRQGSLGLESVRDVKDGLQQLAKLGSTDNSEVKQLLAETKNARRVMIENAQSLTEVLDKFPQLTKYSLIVYELSLISGKAETTMMTAAENMIKNVSLVFKIEPNTETNKSIILRKLYERLSFMKGKKINEHLIIVKEAGKDTKDLLTTEVTSPRLVVYVAEGGIAEAFIVAPNNLRIKIPEPVVSKCLLCLVGVYYAWHSKYPSAYFHTLSYFDQEVLQISIRNKRIDVFNRDVANAIKFAEDNAEYSACDSSGD